MKPRDPGTLDHLPPVRLARLWSLVAESGEAKHSLPDTARSMAAVQGALRGVEWPGGATAADALERARRPVAPLEELREIKQHAKTLLGAAHEESSRDALTFLYHVAIAAAYGSYGLNLSSRPIEARAGLYEDLATLLAGEPIGDLFENCLARLWAEDALGPTADE